MPAPDVRHVELSVEKQGAKTAWAKVEVAVEVAVTYPTVGEVVEVKIVPFHERRLLMAGGVAA